MTSKYYNVFILDDSGNVDERQLSYTFDSETDAVKMAREISAESENVKITWFSRNDYSSGNLEF